MQSLLVYSLARNKDLPTKLVKSNQTVEATLINVEAVKIENHTKIQELKIISDNANSEIYIAEASNIFDSLLTGDVSVQEANSLKVLDDLRLTNEFKQSLEKSRTSKLWLQYMEMVDTLKLFIMAERIGNWNLHVVALKKMLPFYAAAGHNLYTKSVHLYLQQMQKLQEKHPNVYDAFQNEFRVIRRIERYWAGLSADLVIEQVLMRSVKTNPGLTHGRGLNEIQRLIWLLSMPTCVEYNNMSELTSVLYVTSDQHIDSSESRKNERLARSTGNY